MRSVSSYRVRGEITVDGDEGLQQARYFKEWVAPDRTYWRVEGSGENNGHVNEVIFAENRLFTRDSAASGGRWTEQLRVPPVSSPASAIFEGLEEVRFLREEDFEGQPAFRIRGERPPKESSAFIPSEPNIRTLHDLFIHQETYRLLGLITIQSLKSVEQGTVQGTPTSRKLEQSVTANYDYYDYDQPISIHIPSLTPTP